MGRDSIHSKIDELLGVLSINNSRLSLHSEGLSMLDIDVLRKQCIELYEQINKLALQPRAASKPSDTLVQVKQPAKPIEKESAPEPPKQEVVEPTSVEVIPESPKVEIPTQVVEPPMVEIPVPVVPEVVIPTPEPISAPPVVDETKITSPPPQKVSSNKPKDEVKSHRYEDDEMKSLFEKFSSKPIESIAKAISVAKRFEFQSNFFDGEAKEYNTFMSLLDGAHDREEAFAIYHAYKSKFKWDNEDLKDELKALMYRKFS
jgi:hypothetical protein